MNHPSVHSSQYNNLCGVIGLLVVAALCSAALGSGFGFVMIGALIAVLCTRAQWARIVTLVLAAYVGLVGLLVSLFARDQSSFMGFVAALMAGAIFWLLLRPGMDRYFGGTPRSTSQVVPVAPRPGALPHLQHPPATPVAPATTHPAAPRPRASSTQEQWARLQQQLRAEQEMEEREQESLETEDQDRGGSFPWLSLVFAAIVFAYALAVAGEFGKLAMLIVIPGFIAAMLRWVHPRGFVLGALVLSGGLIVQPEWSVVFPEIRMVLQHHGPMVFAAIALLIYAIALASTGLSGNGESHA